MGLRLERWLPGVAVTALAVALVGWNASRFIGAEPRIRTKDLTFLPSVEVGRLLSMGHTNTAAKLRWIDSFAFFQLQLDRKDDRIVGTGESAFLRLYHLLTGLDPYFQPFYEHSTLNLGGIQNRHGDTLGLLQYGLLHQPHNEQLWRLVAVELYSAFRWEERQPESFDSILSQWHEAMKDPQQAQQVWDWKAAFARRREPGLEQVPYWLAQLGTATGPTRDFVLDTLREEVARYGTSSLSSLVQRWKKRQGFLPVRLEDLLDEALLRQEWPQGIPGEGPVTRQGSQWVLRADPFGWPYRLTSDGTVVSDGMEVFRFRGRIQAANNALEAAARSTGAWPATLAEVQAAGVVLPETPVGATWHLRGKVLEVAWPPAPYPAWSPR